MAALPCFVEECPTYEVRAGRMHIQLGDMALAMPIPVFEEGCLRGKDAIARWRLDRLDKGQVVYLRPKA